LGLAGVAATVTLFLTARASTASPALTFRQNPDHG
jgi:hypothetical protein